MASANHKSAIESKRLALWLKAARTEAGLTQEEAAAKSGVKYGVVVKAEQGRDLKASNFVALVLTYNADIRTIFNAPAVAPRISANRFPRAP